MIDWIKKVLLVFKKVLFKQEIERNTHCVYCLKKLTGSQRKFCCDSCNNSYWRDKYKAKKQKQKRLRNLILMKGGLNK